MFDHVLLPSTGVLPVADLAATEAAQSSLIASWVDDHPPPPPPK